MPLGSLALILRVMVAASEVTSTVEGVAVREPSIGGVPSFKLGFINDSLIL